MTDTSATFEDVLQSALSRRKVLVGGFATAAATFFAPQLSTTASAKEGRGNSALAGKPSGVVGGMKEFTGIGISTIDDVVVPEGYIAEPLYRWGDRISGSGGTFSGTDITLAEQLASAGQSHDGMHYFPLASRGPNQRGLLVLNHEITESEFLFKDGTANWTAEKSALAMAAQGCSVIEIKRTGNKWQVMPSGYARRITTMTPMELTGPAAGDALLKTSADPTGTAVLGTANNCASGKTPWATYLTCEENFNAYFGTTTGSASPNALRNRYGVGVAGFGPPLYRSENRFDIVAEPNESNRFGWVVEIDPFDPTSTPKKRTALGRMKHENAELVECSDGRVVVYMGDDERGERIYKFVSANRWEDDPDTVLDSGTLYVAVFSDDLTPGDAKGKGEWVALTPETTGFATMAEILVDTRGAANAVGGTRMDRPEWMAADPKNPGTVYCTLTNNSRRGSQFATDEANPRVGNPFGHIIRWDEAGGDPKATSFTWDIFIFAGDPDTAGAAGNPAPVTAGIPAFGAPDGLWFDGAGALWIQTDGTQPVACNNQMLCADTTTGEVKRFLVGPVGCEVTGITQTPDGTATFVNIQHPGEGGGSDWPDKVGGLPRSSTIVIRRLDGGPVVGPYA
jgi:secreted PhoX family phosphatase